MYKIGEMVVVLPTEGNVKYVGEVEGVKKVTLYDTETGVSHELRYLINGEEVEETDLVSTGEYLIVNGAEVVLTNIGLVDGEYQLTFDNEFTILAEQLYCDEDGLHIYNGESESEAEVENNEFIDSDEFNLGFMLGYLEAVEDSNDYIHTDDCIWDKAINDIDGVCCMYDLIVERRDKLTEFYNKVIELKNLAADTDTDVKPELTLDEIKEKLGYDFNLVD